MELDGKQIGERIRQLRLKRGLTQKELAGEQMTRNMLSLIENGVSLPSLSSLVYLASVLSVPVDYFFSTTEEDEGRYIKLSVIDALRESYRQAQYADCTTRIQTMPPTAVDDEVALLGARAYLHMALASADEYELHTAAVHLKNAGELVQRTVYASEDLKKAINYYKELFALLPTALEFPERLSDLRSACGYIPAEMLLYLGSLRLVGRGAITGKEFPRETHEGRHLQALVALATNRTDTAVRLLRELTQDNALPYYMRYRVYSDLEDATGLTGEYRIAYMAARKKLDLLDAAKK